MNLDSIENNLNLSQTVFKSIILDRNAKRISDTIISWANYASGISKDMYVKEFENLVDNRQFSFLLKDSSIVQIYYEYNEYLIKYKLAFYPVPFIKKISAMEIENFFDEASNDIYLSYYDQLIETFGDEILYTNSNHIRFDYDFGVESHFKNHIQFGGINNLRIPIKFLVLPFTFIDFIARNMYPREFKNISQKPAYKALKSNSHYFELDNLAQHDSLFIHKEF